MLYERDKHSARPLMVIEQSFSSIASPAQSNDGSQSRPQSLGRRNLSDWSALVVQTLLTIFPILFISMALSALFLNNKSVVNTGKKSPTGTTVEKAIRLSPTIFPIMFAAIVGKFFRTLALYLAQRRTRLGTLERLVGSQSFFASVEHQISLRGSYLLGISIITLWALSPIGGQSALRLLRTTRDLVFSNNTVIRYQPIDAQLTSSTTGASAFKSSWAKVSSIFIMSLKMFPLIGNSTRDMFGNVKIPRFDSTHSLLPETDGNFTNIDYTQDIFYTSMLGIPTNGVPQSGNASFNIFSRHFDVNCSQLVILDELEIEEQVFTGMGKSFHLNVTLSDDISLGQAVDFNFTSTGATKVSQFVCTLTARDIESRIICHDGICRVEAIRSTMQDISNKNVSFISILNMFDNLPDITLGPMTGTATGATLVEYWLLAPYENFVDLNEYVDLYKLPLATFSRNFEAVINTLWQSTYAYGLLIGSFPSDDVYSDIRSNYPDNITISNTTADVFSFDDEIYVCNLIFAILLIGISGLILLASLSTLVLMSLIIAPDNFGYVSSSTWDNPYFNRSAASYLSGLERAKAMKDMYVMIGDVHSETDVGHIAFTSDMNAQPLQRGRLYD